MVCFETPGFISYCEEFNTFQIIHRGDTFTVTIFIPGLKFDDNNTDTGLGDLTDISLIEAHPEDLHEDPTELY